MRLSSIPTLASTRGGSPTRRSGGSFYFNAHQLKAAEKMIRNSGSEIPRDIAIQADPYRKLLEASLETNCHSNALLALLSDLGLNEYKLTKHPQSKFMILEQAEPLSHRVSLLPQAHYKQHKLPFLVQEYSGNIRRNPDQPGGVGSVFSQRIRCNYGTPQNPLIQDEQAATFNLDERIHQYLELKHLLQNRDYTYSVNPFQF
jgi:hypothetical protein